MRAGQLRHRVILQTLTPGQDSYGDQTESWGDTATVWAAIEPLRGKEYYDAQQINAEITIRIRIRYRSGVTPVMRVKQGSRIWDIKAVIHPEERKQELELLCVEEV